MNAQNINRGSHVYKCPKYRPVPLRDEMVRALLAGTKTQMREVVTPQPRQIMYQGKPTADWQWPYPGSSTCSRISCKTAGPDDWARDHSPLGQPGDRLWVRESFNWSMTSELIPGENYKVCPERVAYAAQLVVWRADGVERHPGTGVKALRKPSTHMPRWASRFTLEITSVRLERVQSISEADAVAEGTLSWAPCTGIIVPGSVPPRRIPIPARDWFPDMWSSIHGKHQSRPGVTSLAHSWFANPWVWVVEFKRVDA